MIEYLLLILGLGLLYKGADYLVEGSASLAKKFGISPLVIGLTIVAFGTSAPELVVNIYASLEGNSEVVFGNIIGSNIVNILLILGLSGMLVALKVQNSTVWKEIPFALLAALVIFVMSNKVLLGESANVITAGDGLLLLSFFIIFLYYITGLMKQKPQDIGEVKTTGSKAMYIMIAGGLIALYFGGRLTVDSAVGIARQFNISELLISSTIVAIGTSLPELLTSIVAAAKKEMDLSVGNIIGSNIFNIFLIMGISSLISPIAVPASINFDFFALIAASLLLFLFMFIGRKHQLDEWQAISFVVLYASYIAYIIYRG